MTRAPVPASDTFEVTAACPSGQMLSIVTLRWTGRQITLVPSACTAIALIGDDQAGVRMTADLLLSYLEQQHIQQIVVRRPIPNGPRPTSMCTMKFETMLQLMPLKCYHVTTQRVNGWAGRLTCRLPLPQRRLDAAMQKLQARTIETGAFVVEKILSRRGHIR